MLHTEEIIPFVKRSIRTIIYAGLFCTICTMPVYAYDNDATDEIGAATTIYQHYKANTITDALSIDTNVAGESSIIEPFIATSLNLATRLLPFSYDASIQYYADTEPTTFFVTFRNREYNDLNKDVQTKVANLAAEASTFETDYEKIKFINDYLVDHCDYLSEAMEDPDTYHTAFTAYGCLIEGKAVCEGYTNSVQLLCEAMQIPCIKVTGQANGGNHIWNAVYLENKWWMLDTTFNDPIGVQDETDRLRFFLIDMDTFAQIGLHTYDSETFETSKMIFMGRTNGQSKAVQKLNLSAQNAEAQDKPNATLLPTEQKNTQANADALQELGLFAGDERGYRLNEPMTRIEMGVMVMRMHGGIEALQENGAYYQEICPFTDVPDWAKSSIGFLYDNKLVAGQSATTFGTDAVTIRDYAVMMLRILQIEHTYDTALEVALRENIITETQKDNGLVATRGDIVNITCNTLALLKTQAAQTNLDKNSEQKVTTTSAYNTIKNEKAIAETSESSNSLKTTEAINSIENDETLLDYANDTSKEKSTSGEITEKEDESK